MGESSLEEQATHSCENSCTSTSQELLSDASDRFKCSICLELVYKPIAQACGHIFCFWCVHLAMNFRRESHCPVCRRPYMYFPRVCELLHFMLAKVAPEEYERRGHEIQRMEEEKQVFSPRILESPRQLWSPRKDEEAAWLKAQKPNSSSTTRTGAWDNGIVTPDVIAPAHNCDQDRVPESVVSIPTPEKKEIDFEQRDIGLMQSVLTVDDFLCSSCNGLLYRPVVLNCGEVFCEPCLKKSAGRVLHCPSCRDPHPGGSALICLELHHYLESAFPAEYMKRKEDAKPQEPAEKIQSLDCDDGELGTEGYLHAGVGCDGCGMFPIVGDRYHCQECTEKIGFDLCGTCYNNGGSLSGRFNQEHKSSHHMHQVKPGHLVLNMRNGMIQRRRQPQLISDMDDYFNSFID